MKNTRLANLIALQKKSPEDPFFKYAIALEHISSNDYQKAILLFEELYDSNSDFLPTYYQLAKLLEGSNIERAKQIYYEGIKLAMLEKDIKTMNELQSALNILEEDE